MIRNSKDMNLLGLVSVFLALVAVQCNPTSRSDGEILTEPIVVPQKSILITEPQYRTEEMAGAATEPTPVSESNVAVTFLEEAGAVQGNSLLLMVTLLTSYVPQGGKLPLFLGVENNRAHPAEGNLFIELILPNGEAVPLNEGYSSHFLVEPLAKVGEYVVLNLGAATDQTGEILLQLKCLENGIETARKTFALTIGKPILPVFTEVTTNAGVLLQHIPNPKDELPFGNGVAFEDYDQDGYLDIYVTNQVGSNALFHNNSDGTFTDLAVDAGVDLPRMLSTGAAFADYDNDGDRDLYVLGNGPNVLFRNNGDGTFTDVTALARVGDPGRGVTAAWGDYDRDGYLDLYVTNHTSRLTHDYSHIRLGTTPQPDLGAQDVLYHNNGDGTFTDVTGLLGLETTKTATGFVASFIDYDNDGDPDIYLVNDVFVGKANQGNVLWRNDGPDGHGGWRFTNVTASSAADPAIFGMGLATDDYDNDGFPDLFMSNVGRPFLYHNNGNGTFTDVTDQAGVSYAHLYDVNVVSWGVAFFDYDNDGWLDAYLNTGNMMYFGEKIKSDPRFQPNILFRNNRDGTFTDVSGLSGADNPERSRALAYGDYNNDGYLDLFVGNFGGPTALYRNAGGGNNWLVIKTEGTLSNHDGIGAKVRVIVDGLSQVREIRSGSNHGSGSEIGAYFGLGSHNQAERVEITWPSGIVQTLHNIDVNQKLHIVEGKNDFQ